MELNVYHFFPEKLNLYGDRGNMMVLQRRSEWRGIHFNVVEVKQTADLKISDADILFIGGGSDKEQQLVTQDLLRIKSEFSSAVEDGVACLTVCGGYQFLGEYYELQNGEKLKGLHLLDFHTVSKPSRLIGNVSIDSDKMGTIVGFENHSGRTYHSYDALGKVIKGHGNNGEDKKEGLMYKNLIGTYLHGPLLPKNPNVADFLLYTALQRKYGIRSMDNLDDEMELKAKELMWERT